MGQDRVGQDVETIEPNEVIFELQEVPGPDFALKQMSDAIRMATQTPSSATSDAAPSA
ncbi:MAG: hypothetical protein JO115_11205 [Pseudonocardiales bacterium]|nr:hypothetical protein [Pseudonocardiales bacterium]